MTATTPRPMTAPAPEVHPMPLGYQSPLPLKRPVRPLWAAGGALATGLVMFSLALYALLSIARVFTAPEAPTYNRDVWGFLLPMLGIFAGVCVVVGMVFLAVGLKWLGGAARSAE